MENTQKIRRPTLDRIANAVVKTLHKEAKDASVAEMLMALDYIIYLTFAKITEMEKQKQCTKSEP